MDEQTSRQRWKPLLWLGVVAAALAAVAAIVARWWRRRPVEKVPILPEVPPGLTEEEAAARWPEGQDNAVHLKPPRTRRQIWRENVLTIFNVNLVGLVLVQALLAQWWSAFLSLATIALNVGINVGQEMLAMRLLAASQRVVRPKATVVRDGTPRSIDAARVVPGDVVFAGPGDQFPVDGEAVGAGRMVVDESVVTGRRGWQTVRAGDAVYAGSFCMAGRGAYVAQRVGDERRIISRLAGMPVLTAELTPLERVISRILRILLVLVAIFAVTLLAIVLGLDPGVPVDKLNYAASMVFNLAPSGLFLGIVVNYSMATTDLAKLGALVRRARSVESLAEATVICFAEAGILTGTRVELETVGTQLPAEVAPLPESRLRQILGDFARSTSTPGPEARALASTFEGNVRPVHEEAPFLAAMGWSAITFDEPDLRGVFVLGEPPMLESNLARRAPDAAQDSRRPESPSPGAARRLVEPLRRLLKRAPSSRKGLTSGEVQDLPDGRALDRPREVVEEVSELPIPSGEAADAETAATGGRGRASPFRGWALRAREVLRRARREPQPTADVEVAAGQESVLLFAYHPELVPLHDAQGNVRLPQDLIPLCQLRHSQRLRPEAVETVNAFARTGVRAKVFTSDEPGRMVATLRQAGLGKEEEERLSAVGTISGPALEGLTETEWAQAAAENSIFGQVTPEQIGRLVRVLREAGESVAVVGDGVADLLALRQATLAVALHTSAQAALGVADIVLTGSSPRILLNVVEKGQRIVHGSLDVLKLNLTQVFYLALLLAAAAVLRIGFPYSSAQGAPIAIATLALPTVGLSLFAAPGVVHSDSFGRSLARTAAPASVTIAALVLLVYRLFMDRTGLVAYAQLAVTYTLIYAGLLLAVLLKPPWSYRVDRRGARRREWRMAGLALTLALVASLLPSVPLAQKYLDMRWLVHPVDYGIVVLAALGWAAVLSLVWRLIPEGKAGGRGR